MNSSIKTVFCREDDAVRSQGITASTSKKVLLRAIQNAMGSVSYDQDGKRVYYTGPNMDKVRRVVDVDAVWTDPTAVEKMFQTLVDPIITRAVQQQRDVVVFCAGESKTRKSMLIHGDVPEFTLDVPDRSTWGMAYLTVDRLLELSATETPLDITCNFSRVHLEHISDVLVSVATKLDKSDPQKVKSHYARLVALSQGSSLDLEEAANGAKVNFQMLDQVDLPIRGLDDFLHAVNCRGALCSAHGPLMKLISKKGAPFYYVLSFTILPAGASPLSSTPRYINFVETADLDWTGPEEDMGPFRASINSVCSTAAAIERGNFPVAEMATRSSTVGRLSMGNCDLRKTDMIVLGCAKYTHALRMMKLLADCKGRRPFVLLHGPDGEGEDDVDSELRNHVMAVQSQCDSLRHEIELLAQKKDELEFQITRDDNTISRLQEQNTLVRKMTMSAKAAKDALGAVDPHRSGRGSNAATPASLQEQRRAESDARKVARLHALDRDLALMKDEDARKAEATQQQIRFLSQESKRCANNAVALERELATLEKALADQEARFAAEKHQREQEMEEQISTCIAQNRALLESRNAARRAAIRSTQDAILHNHEVAVRQEKLFLEELQRNTTDLAKKIELENAQWDAKLEALGRQLVEVSQQRDAVAAENRAAEQRFDEEMRALDMEAVVLCKYLNDVTNIIWRFENHSSSEVRKIVTIPKCNVQIFDMTAKYSVEELEALCNKTRRWLESRGVPPPLVYHDIESGTMTIADDALATLERLANSGDCRLGDGLDLLRSPMRAR